MLRANNTLGVDPQLLDPNSIADEFDPAIVTLFQHEGFSGLSPLDLRLTYFGQYFDMLNAYLYAKESVLPQIRKDGIKAITPKQVLTWLNEGHARIAASMAGPAEMVAGTYTTIQVVRWEWGADIQDDVDYFIGGDDSRRAKIVERAHKYEVPPAMLEKILTLLIKVRQSKLPLDIEKHCMSLPEAVRQAAIGQNKLHFNYFQKKFSADELLTLRELVVICIPPEKYTGAMNEVAQKIVREWHACDVTNEQQVAELILTAYKGVAGVHPYANGNGRLATWLMNVILRSLNLPSILMREKGDKQNLNSTYSQAIKQIDSNPDIFKNHILARLKKVKTEGRTVHVNEYEMIKARLEVYLILKEMAAVHRDEAESIVVKNSKLVIVKLNKQYKIEEMGVNPHALRDAAILELSLYRESLASLKARAKSVAAKPGALSSLTVTAVKYNDAEIKAIKALLLAITGESEASWTTYTGGTCMMIKAKDMDHAKVIQHALNAHEGLNAESGRIKSGATVVQVKNINLKKLSESVGKLLAKTEKQYAANGLKN